MKMNDDNITRAKMTTKLAWSTTVLDTFTPNNFIEGYQLNFSKASTALYTCARVFATRVDDVIQSTQKLMEIGVINKKRTKKTLTNSKSLKIQPKSTFFDGYFYKTNRQRGFLLNCQLLNGMYRVFEAKQRGFQYELMFLDFVSYECDFIGKQINFHENEVFSVEKEVNEDENEDENQNENEVLESNYIEMDYETPEIQFENVPLEEKNNKYMNLGWAGPNYWNIPKKTPLFQGKQKTKKTVKFLDFKQKIKEASFSIGKNTLLDHKTLKERRKNKNMLPEDHLISLSDIYKFNFFDKSFNTHNVSEISFGNEHDTLDIQKVEDEEKFKTFNETVAENVDLDIDMTQIKSNPLAITLVNNYNRVQKKVDINDLNKKVFNEIKNTTSISIKDVCNKILNGKHETSNLSVQYCVVSLLHIANEKDVLFEMEKDDIFIKNCIEPQISN